VYFLIHGAADLVAALMMAGVFLGSGFDALFAEYSRSSLGALIRAVVGLFLFLYPGSVVRLVTDRVAWGRTSGGRAA
jgi:hypothetical protein